MKLTARWYPRALPERADWHKTFAKEALKSGEDNGLIAAEVAIIQVDSEVVNFYNDGEDYLESQMDEWRKARDSDLDGDEGDPEPAMPAFDLPAKPAGSLNAIAERTEKFAGRIKASANYSESVGAAYGIITSTPVPRPDDEKTPVARTIKTLPNFGVSFKVAMQGMGGIQSEMTRDGDDETHRRFYTDGDIIDDTPPLTAGKAETRQYRFYFIEKNKVTGESSDIYEVTVRP